MRIILQNDCVISQIAAALTAGQTLVYPTETCYGLGCDAGNATAVRKIFQIKGRMEDKPLLVLAADIAMVREYVAPSDLFDRLTQAYWPGALTIVAPMKPGARLAPGVYSASNTIAVRVSSHPFAQKIVAALGRPIISTSANLAGAENPYDTEDVVRMLGGRIIEPDILIDAGKLPMCKPSTIVSVVGERLEVLRQGELVVS